jgi:hypothetical protein
MSGFFVPENFIEPRASTQADKKMAPNKVRGHLFVGRQRRRQIARSGIAAQAE